MKLFVALPLIAVSSLGSSLCVYAQDESTLPAFYGRINITPVLNKPDGDEASGDIVSNASRIGLRGDYALKGDLKLVYQAEYQVNPGDAHFERVKLSQRETFIGVTGNFGQLIVGRHDSPAKTLHNGIDVFNDLNGDIRTLFVSELRPNDVLHYTSPTKSGFTVMYAAILDGQEGVVDRLSASTSMSLTYEQGSFLYGMSVDNNVSGHDSFRLMSRYREGNLQLGLMYEGAENSRGDNNGVVVSVSYAIDKLLLKAQTGAADQKRAGGAQSSIGIDYNMASDSRVFAFMTRTTADDRGIDNDQFGIGFEYKF